MGLRTRHVDGGPAPSGPYSGTVHRAPTRRPHHVIGESTWTGTQRCWPAPDTRTGARFGNPADCVEAAPRKRRRRPFLAPDEGLADGECFAGTVGHRVRAMNQPRGDVAVPIGEKCRLVLGAQLAVPGLD